MKLYRICYVNMAGQGMYDDILAGNIEEAIKKFNIENKHTKGITGIRML